MTHTTEQRRTRDREREEERRVPLNRLDRTRTLIAQAYSGFNTACDGDLIESYVFEINALQARYSYLLRRVKALDRGGPGLQPEGAPRAGTASALR